MMRFSKLAGLAVVPVLSVMLLAGCSQFRIATPQGTATCSVSGQGGNCAMNGRTVSVEPGAGHASGPAQRRTPVPTVSTPLPVTASDSPTPTPSASQQDAVTSVQNCMGQFPSQPKDTLVSFTTSAGSRQDMATCLQIPPQTMALFLRLLFQYAVDALRSGQLNSQQGVTSFTSSTSGDTLPHAVQTCRDQA